MLVALCVLAGLAVIAGLLLLTMELRRHRADPKPAPPLPMEQAARDRWSPLALDLVALLSVLGALLTWQATSTFGAAADLSSRALQDTAPYEAAAAREESFIEYDQRLTQQYGERTVADARLRSQGSSHARGRRLLLVLIGALWLGSCRHASPSRCRRPPADAFTRGPVALSSATPPASSQPAIDALDRVIGARPD